MMSSLYKPGFGAVDVRKHKYHMKTSVEQKMRVMLSSLISGSVKWHGAQQVHTFHLEELK